LTTSGGPPPEVLAYASDLALALGELRPDLVGVYLHGSAVLGGFRATTSDVDVLAVVREPGSVAAQHAMGEMITAVRGCPGTGVEMSVITAATAAVLGDCRFEVHVNTTGGSPVIATGAGRPGDPDLVLHCAVCRDRAVAVIGPPAGDVFGPIPRDRILAAMLGELRWALSHASTEYAVLNACRAVRFADDGRLCSKLDGGHWYLTRHGHDPVVRAALDFRRHGRQAPAADDATGFVEDACGRLRDLLAPPGRASGRSR
jgi:streptomycin 3"-adenylyltransferase